MPADFSFSHTGTGERGVVVIIIIIYLLGLSSEKLIAKEHGRNNVEMAAHCKCVAYHFELRIVKTDISPAKSQCACH